jgi:hypothetical protein
MLFSQSVSSASIISVWRVVFRWAFGGMELVYRIRRICHAGGDYTGCAKATGCGRKAVRAQNACAKDRRERSQIKRNSPAGAELFAGNALPSG